MLNREDIIRIVKELYLPINEYWVTSGSALVLHGVKESTRDIDLGCTSDIAQLYIEKGCTYKIVEDNSRIVIVNDLVELIENWFVDEIEFVDGLPVGSLESIKKQKLNLSREKDISDVKLIDEFIKNKK
jgi:hypothetical protein